MFGRLMPPAGPSTIMFKPSTVVLKPSTMVLDASAVVIAREARADQGLFRVVDAAASRMIDHLGSPVGVRRPERPEPIATPHHTEHPMQIRLIDGRIPTTPAMLEFVQTKVQCAVGRFADRVREISVRIADLNGPRGGVDKQCTMIAALSRGGTAEVVVKHRDADFYAAIAGAAHALKPVVANRLERAKSARRGQES
jgi:ribosome-associated translation inhibitor RaiA